MKYRNLLEEIKEGKISLSFPPHYRLFPQEISTTKDFDLLKEKLRAYEGKYLVVDVWNFRATLSVRTFDETGSETSETVVDMPPELQEILEAGVYEAGGAPNVSGIYPLSRKVVLRLVQEIEKIRKSC